MLPETFKDGTFKFLPCLLSRDVYLNSFSMIVRTNTVNVENSITIFKPNLISRDVILSKDTDKM